ncbi:hypothetical protein HUK48_03120 [Prevotella corporis]|nr:hypothetical protein [Prevotella corporis]MDQ7736423.1 hypothetical protein [Prevotella corporis]
MAKAHLSQRHSSTNEGQDGRSTTRKLNHHHPIGLNIIDDALPDSVR